MIAPESRLTSELHGSSISNPARRCGLRSIKRHGQARLRSASLRIQGPSYATTRPTFFAVAEDIMPIAELKARLFDTVRSLDDRGRPLVITLERQARRVVLMSAKEFDLIKYREYVMTEISHGLADDAAGDTVSSEEPGVVRHSAIGRRAPSGERPLDKARRGASLRRWRLHRRRRPDRRRSLDRAGFGTSGQGCASFLNAGRRVPEFARDDVREVFVRTYRIMCRVDRRSIFVFCVLKDINNWLTTSIPHRSRIR